MKALISIIISLLVSGSVSFFSSLFFINILNIHHNWVWLFFVWFYIILLSLEKLISTIIKNNNEITRQQILSEKQRYQKITVSCCKCSTINEASLDLTKDNYFECQNCKTNNKILSVFKGILPYSPENNINIDEKIKNGEIGY